VTERARARDGWLVAAVALVVRAAVVAWAWGRIPPVADGVYYDTIARRLADGQGYSWLWPDGTVTAAAHYPVGYPAMVAAAYRLFGAEPGWAMVESTLLGAAGAAAIFAFAARRASRRAAIAAGLAFALHPALVSYTPALMTEGITASLLAIVLYLARRATEARSFGWAALLGLGVAAATYVRPQNILLAPLLPLAMTFVSGATLRRIAAVALLATAAAGLAIVPWTLRNCDAMGRCALVSVNGGWNLHIGTDQEAGGTWAPIKVPAGCREVWDEAEKDACFGRAAREAITAEPAQWLRLAPAKMAVTFEYFGAGPWYLHTANAAVFSQTAKTAWGAAEVIFHRALLVVCLAAVLRRLVSLLPSSGTRARRAAPWVAAFGLALSGTVGTLVLGAAAALAAVHPRTRAVVGPAVPAAAVVLLATAAVHAVFFGAGRYGLVIIPAMAALLAEIDAFDSRGQSRASFASCP
jgi:4-amino-4-deoxy-L-arabinose transferase-like glycosyltransferase